MADTSLKILKIVYLCMQSYYFPLLLFLPMLPKLIHEQVRRLGGEYVPDTRQSSLPQSLHAFCKNIIWPKRRHFEGHFNELDVFWLSFDLCRQEEDRLFIGYYDGGNSLLFVALDDEQPDNPTVFALDREENEATALASLLDLLKGLEVDATK